VVQFAFLAVLVFLILAEDKYIVKIDFPSSLILSYVFVHLVSILINLTYAENTLRLFAAINSALIWVIAILYYIYYINHEVDMKAIGKYLTIDLLMLVLLSSIAIVLNRLQINSPKLFSKWLFTDDWILGIKSFRLVAFMYYSNLINFFFFSIFPFSYYYLKERLKLPLLIGFIMIAVLPVIYSHSRIGILLSTFVVIVCLFDLISTRKHINVIILIFIFLILMLIINFYGNIFNTLINLVIELVNSTDTRENLYRISIELAKEKSPIFGLGIKNILYGAPLGSHSTFIIIEVNVFFKYLNFGMIYIASNIALIIKILQCTVLLFS
jgi:hypothetical protein